MDAIKTVLFDKTPVMSTYLLAWFIGEFEYVEAKTSRDIKVRTWASVGKKEMGIFVCETVCRCLDFYENIRILPVSKKKKKIGLCGECGGHKKKRFFEIEYPLPKCDMVAVPDFGSGAMENWGLVTYQESIIMVTKGVTPVPQLQRAARIVCHELAHQWFGNLVTMDWWSELWLNEGFARFMDISVVPSFFPHWPMWDLFVVYSFAMAFELDGMTTSHPIEVEVQTAEQADEVFDSISYAKGASVIRMLQGYLGDDVFRKGLTKYLNNFRYSNAKTIDLWDFLGKEMKAPVGTIMRNWTKEQGFPLVTGVRSEDKLILTQVRHLSSGTLNKEQVFFVFELLYTYK
ncbi:hypothetical protein RFI_23676 [Reticulomyxa filosa]|uniref:Peptidase M1 membrane alanine aminopeptidase domain-containing protein n=1 Tax=Reticulomyxa filosa TaxID=46433 RepID=X6MII4_RETFI|nr:hypothetical protein RFI_23676 [Reticulomyxa filosa]|eukprot:ETO13694.1 hypothetical protein RFI_23676 [Reticulomyxa filosa]